jgi:tellurite resistance protein TerC
MGQDTWLFIGFNIFVLLMLALDLGVFHKQAHAVKVKEALIWSAVWIALALVFNAIIWYFKGAEKGLEFFTGYLIEKSLSIDNIFVFLLIFSYFQVPEKYQHRVLLWGVLGALVMRAIFIFAGIELIQRFHWMVYIFGGFLLLTGIKMFRQTDQKIEPDKNPLVRLFKRFMPVTPGYIGQQFFTKINGKTFATPLFLVLLMVEFSDLVFAVDSIPAILAITDDWFIVYTSNVFAILGLRSLYFALAGVMNWFSYLKYGLAAVLVFVGVKLCISGFYKMPIAASLLVIAGILGISVVASIVKKRKEAKV